MYLPTNISIECRYYVLELKTSVILNSVFNTATSFVLRNVRQITRQSIRYPTLILINTLPIQYIRHKGDTLL